jgi:hypothetical protein
MTVTEKDIFAYKGNNGEDLFGDPIAIRWRLAKLLGGSPEKALLATKSRDPVTAITAMDKLRSAVCIAFNLGDPFDISTGNGVRQETWHGAVKEFLKWCRETRHFFGQTPTLRRHTECSPAHSITEPESVCT